MANRLDLSRTSHDKRVHVLCVCGLHIEHTHVQTLWRDMFIIKMPRNVINRSVFASLHHVACWRLFVTCMLLLLRHSNRMNHTTQYVWPNSPHLHHQSCSGEKRVHIHIVTFKYTRECFPSAQTYRSNPIIVYQLIICVRVCRFECSASAPASDAGLCC